MRNFTCVTTLVIDRHIAKAQAKYLATTLSREFGVQTLSYFGTDQLISKGYPIKGIFDILIQLAGRLYFGYSRASWEAVSHANFHEGRPDMLQVRLEDEPLPTIFTDPAYLQHGRQLLVVNYMDESCRTSVHFLPDSESVRMMYHVSDDK
jgi:hypothetical protein